MPSARLAIARAVSVGLATTLAAAACSASPTPGAGETPGADTTASLRPAPSETTTGEAMLGSSVTAPASSAATPPPAAPTESTTTRPQALPSSTADPGATSSPAAALLGGLDVPWSVALLPDGSSLVSVRNTGDVWHLPRPGSGGRAQVAGTLPSVHDAGEGGLLGLAVPDDFDVNPVVYAYYSTDNDNRIAAVPWRDGRLGEPQVIFDRIPVGINHDGGRIAFGPDGWLYVGTGETGDTSLSQNLASLGGKILRLTPEGKPAPGNPFGGSPIWSYGHRNVQGLAWDSEDRLWASELGANEWDELNLIKPGENYGWPDVEGRAGNPRFVDPVAQWPTSEMSPSGIAVGPDGAVYLAALRGESVWRVPVKADGTAGTPTRHLEGTYGRIRDIRFVDGRAWILTNNGDDDRLMSLPLSDVGAA